MNFFRRNIILALVLGIGLLGCAAETFKYKPPAYTDVSSLNSKTVLKSKDEVWKSLAERLETSSFAINKLDKKMGLVNLSYSGNPEKYVNCGDLYYAVKLQDKRQDYNFAASKHYVSYLEYDPTNKCVWAQDRTLDLESKINLVVEELKPNKTMVTVDVKYTLVKIIRGQVTQVDNPFGGTLLGQVGNRAESCSFSTNEEGSFKDSDIICTSTGKLEEEILALIQ